jgi:PAS domain S-box-containing protein
MHEGQTQTATRQAAANPALDAGIRKIERREWWLWASAIVVTLLLTMGILSFALPALPRVTQLDFHEMNTAVRGLVGLVLLFDIYTIYQQLQISSIRRQLSERDELFRLISENAADMIALVDARGHRVYNSPGYYKILGYTPEELQSTGSLEQIHPEDRSLVDQAAQHAFRGEGGRRIEYRMRHKDGGWRTLESTASPVLNAAGAVEKLVIVSRDISDRKRLEEQFRQAQKMEAIGRLSGGVAHDFNNLLGLVIGYGEILQEKLPPQDPLRRNADEILNAGRRAAALTRQLLAFSRQQVLETKVLDLNLVVSGMESMLRRLIGEDLELSCVCDPSLGAIKADQGQLEQVILNLAVNARDAMPQGGKLVIATANTEMDEVFVQRYSYPVKPGRYVLLTVSDTGVGMDAATRLRIFEPFFTTKEKGKGTGLGLSMVYGVVKQSDGYIDVDSEPGAGTTFRIYLPWVASAVSAEKPSAGPATPLHGNETVLLVEDQADLRILTRNMLETCGYHVLEAGNGSEALDVMQGYGGKIDALLTDIVMPGIGGRALAQQLAERLPALKVVYMSGYTGQTVGAHGVLEPGSVFVQKPFTRDSLALKVREALDGGQVAAASAGN